MFIDEEKCIGCGNCVAYCPTGAIYVKHSDSGYVAEINSEECVECGVCERMMNRDVQDRILAKEICPTKSFYSVDLEYPRSIRQIFSDPTRVKKETGVFGRGTEEVKTIDVTRRVSEDEIGMNIELGRPGIGTRLTEIDKMAQAIAGLGITFEHDNPLTLLMKDQKSGELKSEILDEKVLSAIIEFRLKPENVPRVLDAIFNTEVNTVFVVGLFWITGNGEKTNISNIVKGAGYSLSLNGKTNIGYGRRVQAEVSS